MEVKRADADATATEIADRMERVTQRQQRFERHLARRLGIDAPGLATMEHVMRAGEATPTELARKLGISTAAMTLVLDRLTAAGHVARRPHPTDRRKVIVTAEPAATAAAHALVDPLITGVESVVGSLEPQEQETVATFLGRILRVYDEVLDSDDSQDRPTTS